MLLTWVRICDQPCFTIPELAADCHELIYCSALQQCFSTGVPRNLRVPSVVSKGSTVQPMLSKKLNCVQHLQPLDTFSRLLVGPKCICSPGCASNTPGGAYSALPDLVAGGVEARLPHSRPSVLNFGSSGLRSPPKKDMGSVSNQNCCKGFCFTEKVEKHWWVYIITEELIYTYVKGPLCMLCESYLLSLWMKWTSCIDSLFHNCVTRQLTGCTRRQWLVHIWVAFVKSVECWSCSPVMPNF